MPDTLGSLVGAYTAQNALVAIAAQSVATAELTNSQGKVLATSSFPTTADQASIDPPINQKIQSFDRRHSETSYDKTNYGSRRLLTYPLDLASRPENMNYMLFDIFTTEGQGLDTVTRTSFLASTAVGGVLASQLSGVGGVVGKVVGIGGATVAGAAITQGDAVLAGLGDLVKGSRDALNYNDSSEIGFVQASTGFKQPMNKVPTSIALYMPTGINSKYDAYYEDSASFAGLGDISTLVVGNSEEAGIASQNLGRNQLKIVDDTIKSLGIVGDGAGFTDILKASQRAIPNPQILQLFKEVKRRSFQFSYTFIPTSEEEAQSVYHIIRAFKYYSLPKRGDNRMLEFPAEFRITFMHGGNENLYLPRIARCALTSVDVKYHDGANPFTVFRPVAGRNGTPPTKIDLSLMFSEVEILTAERIDQGY